MGVGLIAYLAKSGLINLGRLERLIISWPFTVAALALILLHIILISVRLSLLFQPQGLTLPLKTSLRLTLVGLFFDIFLPGASGGPAVVLYYATRQNGGRRAEVATVVVFDRIIGLFSLFVLPLIFAPVFPHLLASVQVLRVILLSYSAVAFLMLGLFLLCLWSPSGANRLVSAIHFRLLRNWASRALETVRAYRRSPATLAASLALSLLANLSMVGVIALALLVVNPASVAWRLCLIAPIGQIVNSLPITPGGLGVGEMAFNTLFKLSGLSGGAEAILCWRVWAALLSGLGLFFYLRGMEPCVVTRPAPMGGASSDNPVAPEADSARSARSSDYARPWRASKRLTFR